MLSWQQPTFIMIYYDPTEGRENTRLSQMIIKKGKPLSNLESLTGGDILISPVPIPTHSIDNPVGKKVFDNNIGKSFLIQRKSGNDLLQSIPHLQDILRRMQEWDSMNWLCTTGDYFYDNDMKVVCNGRETQWHYNSYLGVLIAWQIAGGKYMHFADDEMLGQWILSFDEKVKKLADNPEWFVHQPKDVSHLKHDPRPWRAVLEGFPGVGAELSMKIANYCEDLATSLLWMTSPDAKGIKGVGTGSKLKWIKFAGLDPDECLCRAERDDNAFHIWAQKVEEVDMESVSTLDELFEKIDEVEF